MGKLSWGLIKSLKVRSKKTIASLNSKANDNQLYPIHNKNVIWLNASILIIMLIERLEVAEVERLKVGIGI